MKFITAFLLFSAATLQAQYSSLQIPKIISYQGRVTQNGVPWNPGTGEGYFVFALVQNGSVLWNNYDGNANPSDPASVGLGVDQMLPLPVSGGQFSVRLGNSGTSGKNREVPATVFFDVNSNAVRGNVKLAVWFSADANTFTRLFPDVDLASVPYAMVAGIAESVQDRAIATAKLADGAITSAKLASGGAGAGQFQVTSNQISAGAVGAAQLASGAVTSDKIDNDALTALSSTLVQGQGSAVPGMTALEPIAALDAVAVTKDGSGNPRLVKANASVGSRFAYYGFAQTGAAADAVVTVQQFGALAGFSGLVPGSSYYLGATDGTITPTYPASNPIYVGYALSASALFVDPFGVTKKWSNQNYWGNGSNGALSTIGDEILPSTQDGDVVVKQYTSLTINAGHTMTVSQRCRGLVVYVDGNCTINGTLTMTARGASVNPGIDANSIPATGIRLVRRKLGATDTLIGSDVGGTGAGGVGAAWRALEALQPGIENNGKIYVIAREGGPTGPVLPSAGQSIANGTGGGGTSGGAGNVERAWGSTGTCYSGGTGGGGPASGAQTSSPASGSPFGGAGGIGGGSTHALNYGGGGGAGNPGGAGGSGGAGNGGTAQSGTGGLLVLFVRGNLTLGQVGLISADGSQGGSGNTYSGPGGGSGGGRIIVLHAGLWSGPVSSVRANGGLGGGGNYTSYPGGNGAITIDQIDP